MQVIVVDVEDRDDSVWHNLTPLDGGLSGWRLLWDRWCPIPSLRCPLLHSTHMLSQFWEDQHLCKGSRRLSATHGYLRL